MDQQSEAMDQKGAAMGQEGEAMGQMGEAMGQMGEAMDQQGGAMDQKGGAMGQQAEGVVADQRVEAMDQTVAGEAWAEVQGSVRVEKVESHQAYAGWLNQTVGIYQALAAAAARCLPAPTSPPLSGMAMER